MQQSLQKPKKVKHDLSLKNGRQIRVAGAFQSEEDSDSDSKAAIYDNDFISNPSDGDMSVDGDDVEEGWGQLPP